MRYYCGIKKVFGIIVLTMVVTACSSKKDKAKETEALEKQYIEFLIEACNHRNGLACYQLARESETKRNGSIVHANLPNFNEAKMYETSAALLNNGCHNISSGLSCYYAGFIYQNAGQPTFSKSAMRLLSSTETQDIKKATAYYKLGCELENAKACEGLGEVLSKETIESSQQKQSAYMKAAELFTIACDAGEKRYKSCDRAASI